MQIPYEWADKLRAALVHTASLEIANPTQEWFIREVLSYLGLQTPQATAKAGLPDPEGLVAAIAHYYTERFGTGSSRETLQEAMLLKTWDEYRKLVTQAYEQAPAMEPGAAGHWHALNASNHRLFKQLLSRVKIIFVSGEQHMGGHVLTIDGRQYPVEYFPGGQPYDTQPQMKGDYEQTGTLRISIDYSDHPIFSVEDNIVFRTVHDFIVHIQGNHPFGAKGEIASYNLHSKLAPLDALPALFTEVVGQACFAVTHGDFPQQKIAVLKGFDYRQVGKVEGYDIQNKELVKAGAQPEAEAKPSVIQERQDLEKAAAVRSVVDDYPTYLASAARELVEKYSDPTLAGRRGVALNLHQALNALTHFQGNKIKLQAPPEPGDEGQYDVHTRTVTIFDASIARLLERFRQQVVRMVAAHRDSAQLAEAKQEALGLCQALEAADWSVVRNTFYHEITHQQDDQQGRMRPSFANLRKQLDDNPKLGNRMNRYYYNSAHETNARFVARVAEMSSKYQNQTLPELLAFVKEFTSDDEFYYEHLTGANKQATLKRIYDLYQQLKAMGENPGVLQERNDQARISQMRAIADGYFPHFKAALKAFYDKFIGTPYNPEEAPFLSTVRDVYWGEIFRYQGVRYEIEAASPTGQFARYRPALLSRGRKLAGSVVLYDQRVNALLKELENNTIDYQSPYTKPQARAAARRQAVAAYKELMGYDYERFRHDLYHELTHQQDDEQGWLVKSAENMVAKQAGIGGLKKGRIYVNTPHELNAHFSAVAGEVAADLENGRYALPSFEVFRKDFISKPELQFGHLSAENQRRVMTRVYSFYQELTSASELKPTTLAEQEQPQRLTPETPMYRFCEPEEIELLVNGSVAGHFWLNRPYYGAEDHVYLKTTYGTLKTTDQGRYQNGSTMTASGRLTANDPFQLVRVHEGKETELPLDPYRWNVAPAPMQVNMEYHDGTPKEWVDDLTEPTVRINFWRFIPEQPFGVSRADSDTSVPFMSYEAAAKFVAKLQQGFHPTMLRENYDDDQRKLVSPVSKDQLRDIADETYAAKEFVSGWGPDATMDGPGGEKAAAAEGQNALVVQAFIKALAKWCPSLRRFRREPQVNPWQTGEHGEAVYTLAFHLAWTTAERPRESYPTPRLNLTFFVAPEKRVFSLRHLAQPSQADPVRLQYGTEGPWGGEEHPFADLQQQLTLLERALELWAATCTHRYGEYQAPKAPRPRTVLYEEVDPESGLTYAKDLNEYYERATARVRARHAGKPEPPKLLRPKEPEETLADGSPRYKQTMLGTLDRKAWRELLRPKGGLLSEGPVSQYRDNKYFPGATIKYPDNIFARIQSPREAQVAIEFYQKQVAAFNQLFGRRIQLSATVTGNGAETNFRVVTRNENGLEPEYFAYPTATMGEHQIQRHIDKFVPATSLRHELLHEAIVPFITEKFELINHLDQSAAAASIEQVQRDRAFSYSLEDVFYERVVEHLERLPDFQDTFPMSDFGKDWMARLAHEHGQQPLTREALLKTQQAFLQHDQTTNRFLLQVLPALLSKVSLQGITSLEQLAGPLGKNFEAWFNAQKNIFARELQAKLATFGERFMEFYRGALTKLQPRTVNKQQVIQEAYDDFVRKEKIGWSAGRQAYEAERDPQLVAHSLLATQSVYNDGGSVVDAERAGNRGADWEVLCAGLRAALEKAAPLLRTAERREQLGQDELYRLSYSLTWQSVAPANTTSGVEANLERVLRSEPVADPTRPVNRGEVTPQLFLQVAAHPDKRVFALNLAPSPSVAEAYPELADHCSVKTPGPIAFSQLRSLTPQLREALAYFEAFCHRRFGERLVTPRKASDVLLQEGKNQGETLAVKITNLDAHDKARLIAMFTAMDWAAGAGAHRGFNVSMDGDGSFRARFEFDGELSKEELDELVAEMEAEKLHIGLGG